MVKEGTDDRGVPGVLHDLERVLERLRKPTVWHGQADPGHRLGEVLPILGHLDGTLVCTDQLHPVLLQHPLVVELHRDGERGLPSHGREERIGPLLLDDPGHPFRGERLHVGTVRQIGIRHDRGGIRVHQDHPVAFLLQGANGLGP
jgi:hypothetical protein